MSGYSSQVGKVPLWSPLHGKEAGGSPGRALEPQVRDLGPEAEEVLGQARSEEGRRRKSGHLLCRDHVYSLTSALAFR